MTRGWHGNSLGHSIAGRLGGLKNRRVKQKDEMSK